MTDTNHIEACPFCGTPRPVIARREQLGGTEFQYVTCTACGARGPERMVVSPMDQQKAINFWNRRALSARASAGEGVPEITPALASWFIAALGDIPDDYQRITTEQVMEALRANVEHFTAAPQPAQAGASGGGEVVPVNCRERLHAEGKPYPKSGCEACGKFAPRWRECSVLLKAKTTTPASPATGEDVTDALHTLQALLDKHGDSQHENALDVLHGHIRRHATPQHVGNEWADMAANGVQWLRNIRDGISTADEALAEMESNARRITALTPASPATVEEKPRPDPSMCAHKFMGHGHRCLRCGWDFTNGDVPPTPPAHGDGEVWIDRTDLADIQSGRRCKAVVFAEAFDGDCIPLTTRPAPEANWVNDLWNRRRAEAADLDKGEEFAKGEAAGIRSVLVEVVMLVTRGALALPAQGEGNDARG